MSSGVTWKFGGTSIEATRSSGAVWTVSDYEMGGMTLEPRADQLDILHGERERYAPLPNPSWDWGLTIAIDAAGVTGSSATDTSRLMDAWREACTFFAPLDGAAKLEATSTDSNGVAVVRHVYANPLAMPPFKIRNADPAGLGDPGAYLVAGAPYAVFKVGGSVRFPWWIRSSLITTDTAPAAAELAVSGSADTVTINNPGDRWVGIKFTVKAASVSGTVNGFTVTNDTYGDVMKITKSTAMAAAEYVDWLATDPREVDQTSTWLYGTGDSKMRIYPGNNTLSIARTGAGSGSLTLQLAWPSLHYSL